MSDEINMTISIPTDDEGYVLLQCEQMIIHLLRQLQILGQQQII